MIIERIDSYTHVPKEKLVLQPSFPTSMKIELTSRCNFKCSFCASKDSKRPQGDIDKKFLYRILNEAKEIGVKEIGLFLLGESFLVNELPEYIKYAKDIGIEYVFITTNGSLCTPEKFLEVQKAALDSLKFSVNAGSKERYNEMHGVNAFDMIMSNIQWISEYKKVYHLKSPTFCVSAIFMEEYKKELEDFRELISPYIDEFYYLPLYNQAGHINLKGAMIGNPGRFDNMAPPIPCWMLFNAAKVTWDGKFTACCFDHDTKFEIGDLDKMTLKEAWLHPKMLKLRQEHLTGNITKDSLCYKCLHENT